MNFIVNFFRLIIGLEGLIWFLVGGLTYIFLTFISKELKSIEKYRKAVFSLAVLSVLTIDFTIFWMFESYLENEVKAANMGLISFGGIAVIFALIAYRLFKKEIETVK